MLKITWGRYKVGKYFSPLPPKKDMSDQKGKLTVQLRFGKSSDQTELTVNIRLGYHVCG